MTSSLAATPTEPRGQDAPNTQDALAEMLTRELETLGRQVDGLVRPISAERRNAPAANGGWSIEAILEHLCLANTAYLDAMRTAVARAGPDAKRTSGDWHPTLIGRLFVRSMQSSWRLPAPRSIVPGPAPRDQVLDAFLESNVALRSLVRQARELEWARVRMVSPLSRLVRLNLGDAALVVLRHGERHARQMLRVHRSLDA